MEISGWKLAGRMGRGSITDTFLAMNAAGKKVAARQLLPKYAEIEDVRTRFLSLGQDSTKIKIRKHIAVVSGQHSSSEGAFLLREYVEGASLRRLIAEERLASVDSSRILLDLAEAVRALHRAGLVHGGIHPGNIIVQPDGRAKLTDFCASRLVLAQKMSRSYPVEMLRYLAPEQWRTGKGDIRADLYSVGMVAHLFVSGTEPFAAISDHTELRDAAVRGVSEMRPSLKQALDPNPESRISSPEELADLLKALAPEEGQESGGRNSIVEIRDDWPAEPVGESEIAPAPAPAAQEDAAPARQTDDPPNPQEIPEAEDIPKPSPTPVMPPGRLVSVRYINDDCELMGNTPNARILHPRSSKANKLAVQLSNSDTGELDLEISANGNGITASDSRVRLAPGAKHNLSIRLQPDCGEYTNILLAWREGRRNCQFRITIVRN